MRIFLSLMFLLSFSVAVEAVDHTVFFPVLVDIKGWNGSDLTGMVRGDGGSKIIVAARTYARGENHFSVMVSYGLAATPYAVVFMHPNMQALMTMNGVMIKSLSIAGRPAKIIREPSHMAPFVLVLLGRGSSGVPVVMQFDFSGVPGISVDEALSIVKQFPIARAVKIARGL